MMARRARQTQDPETRRVSEESPVGSFQVATLDRTPFPSPSLFTWKSKPRSVPALAPAVSAMAASTT